MNHIHIIRLAALACALSAVAAFAQAPANQHPIRLGADQAGGNVFRGKIAAVRLYDRPLRADELKALAAASPDAKSAAPGLVGQRLQPRLPAEPIANDRKLGFPLGCTIEAWVRPDEGASGRIVDKITPGGTDGFLLDTHPGNALRLIVGNETLTRALPHSDRWTHAAATVDGDGVLALFVNSLRVAGSGAESDGVSVAGAASGPGRPLTLWYRRPAARGCASTSGNTTPSRAIRTICAASGRR